MAATLKGKTLFITGASRGIGREIALRAGKDGASKDGTAALMARLAQIDWAHIWRTGHTDEGQQHIGRMLDEILLDMNRGAVGKLANAGFALDLDGLAEALPNVLRMLLLSLPSYLGNRYHAHDRSGARTFAAARPSRTLPR